MPPRSFCSAELAWRCYTTPRASSDNTNIETDSMLGSFDMHDSSSTKPCSATVLHYSGCVAFINLLSVKATLSKLEPFFLAVH